MSDSFNSPNQLSFEQSKESTPEPNVPAVNEQSAVASPISMLEDFEDEFTNLESQEVSNSESSFEEASFEVIADYVEAEVGVTGPLGAELKADGATVSENESESTSTDLTSERLEDADAESKADESGMEEGQESVSAEAAVDLVETDDAELDGNSSAEPIEIPLIETVSEQVESAEAEAADSHLDIDSQQVVHSDDAEQLVEASTDAIDETSNEAEALAAEAAEETPSETEMEADDDSVDATDTENIEEEEVTESFAASVEVVDVEILESQEQERSYEVHQDGSLTYFQYFLDEEDSAFGPGYGDWRGEVNSSPRSFVSATAVGVGVLAATFGAGLLMAEATNRNSISDNPKGESEAKSKADAELKASEASELAQASSPESTLPDWSATQKAIAVSQGSAQASPSLGSAAAILSGQNSPATSSVTSRLAPLAQSWGAAIPMPPPALPVASAPIVTTASLPTPTVAPVNLAALQPVPSYQTVAPLASAQPAAVVNPPAITPQQDEQQLRARMSALRERTADPFASDALAQDGSLLSGPDERWVNNVPRRVNVPLNEGGTSLSGAFESPERPSLIDSPYSDPTVANAPLVVPPSDASLSATAPRPVATAPQAYPLDLAPVVVPPGQAPSLDEEIVAPVAGLLPTPIVPAPVEQLPPRASATPPHAVEQAAQVAPLSVAAETAPEQMAMEVTPGAIALEVIPPTLSAPVLTAPEANAAAMADVSAVVVETQAMSPQSPQAVAPTMETTVASPGITSLVELTETQSAQPVALSRDTARAALSNAAQLNQFRVLPLTVSEYQRLWQESGNDATFAPVHGFVDYGQNVIAVVVTRGEASELNASLEGEANLQAIDQAHTSNLTEVSAQTIAPVSALSQS